MKRYVKAPIEVDSKDRRLCLEKCRGYVWSRGFDSGGTIMGQCLVFDEVLRGDSQPLRCNACLRAEKREG